MDGKELLKLDYTYRVVENNQLNTAKNNGNIQSQTITVPTVGTSTGFTAVQTYTYDSLNRIDDAKEVIGSTETWKQDYTFDRYGNRNLDEANTTTIPKNCGTSPNFTVCVADRKVFNPSISASTNRINLDQDGDSVNDYAFDSSGNTTKDANGRTFIYDAENKQIEVKNSSNETIGRYWYDGDGRRVKKLGWINGQWEETIFVYDASSRLVAEYSTIPNPTPQVAYLTNDHLGSPRINTNELGAVISRHDYRPYGEEVTERTHAHYAGDTIRKQFTGYERDDETEMDYAQARYYSNLYGRFTSVDPSRRSIELTVPQSWNRYLYTLNNPTRFVDRNGKWPTETHSNILARALNLINQDTMSRIQRGSRKVDRDGLNPKTMWEKNAPQHAMTPGKWVKESGLEEARNRAREAAVGFVNAKLDEAKKEFEKAQRATNPFFDKRAATLNALENFGAAMHPIMDNVSPAHKGFQVYDNLSTAQLGATVNPNPIVGAAAAVVGGLIDHKETESRDPTDEEMNLMVDEIRMRYRETFGDEAYITAVSEDERKKTEIRLAKRGTEGMLR